VVIAFGVSLGLTSHFLLSKEKAAEPVETSTAASENFGQPQKYRC
jgi:hypothetical protein